MRPLSHGSEQSEFETSAYDIALSSTNFEVTARGKQRAENKLSFVQAALR